MIHREKTELTVAANKSSANRVDWEMQSGENGSEQPQPEANVVPFPRDWLGPRDELVPFGPAAPNESSGGSADSDNLGSAAASAFWGEDSAAVQEPELVSVPRDTVSRRFALRGRWMALSALAGVVALTALITAALIGHTRSGLPTSATAAPLTLFGGLNSSLIAGAHAAGQLAAHQWPQPHPAARRPVAVRTASRGHAEPSTAAAAASSPAPSSTATQVAQVVQQPVAPRAHVPSTPEASTATSAHSSTGGRTPAFGAGGALGPGHSPNG